MAVKCRQCKKTVRKNQHALRCESCAGWTHRACDTGVSREQYIQLVSNSDEFSFTCQQCTTSPSTENMSVEITVGQFSVTLESEPANTSDLHTPSEHIEEINDFAERSLDFSQEDEAALDHDGSEEPEFTILQTGSQKGKPLLVSVNGYSYVHKTTRGKKVYWRCSQRGGKNKCNATVTQDKDTETYSVGAATHSHPTEPGSLQEAKIKMKVKETAVSHIHESGRAIAESVTDEVAGNNPIPGGLSDPILLARIANRCREKLRPKDPKDLEFELVEDFLPDDFLRGDITVKGERHLLFASERQLALLALAQHWFLDGTFKIVRDPFYQLMSVHAFLRVGKNMKMVPLFFVVMSRRRECDYVKVLRKLLESLPHPPSVKAITMDYERATWLALGKVFPGVKLRGCVFHFVQAIWRNCQKFGLTVGIVESTAETTKEH